MRSSNKGVKQRRPKPQPKPEPQPNGSTGKTRNRKNKKNMRASQVPPTAKASLEVTMSSLTPSSPPTEGLPSGSGSLDSVVVKQGGNKENMATFASKDACTSDMAVTMVEGADCLNSAVAGQAATTATIAEEEDEDGGSLVCLTASLAPFSIHFSPISATDSYNERAHEMGPVTARRIVSDEVPPITTLRQQQHDARLFKDLTSQQPSTVPADVATTTAPITTAAAATSASTWPPLATVQVKTNATMPAVLPAMETKVAVITSSEGGEAFELAATGGEQHGPRRAAVRRDYLLDDGYDEYVALCGPQQLKYLPMRPISSSSRRVSPWSVSSISGGGEVAAAGAGKGISSSRSPTEVESSSPSPMAMPMMAAAASWSPTRSTPFASIVCSDVFIFLVGTTEIGHFAIHRAVLADLPSPQLKKTLALCQDSRTVRLRGVEPDIFVLFSEWVYTRKYTTPKPKIKARAAAPDTTTTSFGIHYWSEDAPTSVPATPKKTAHRPTPVADSIRSSWERLGRDPNACGLCGGPVAWLSLECRQCKGPAVASRCLETKCARSLAAGEPECHAPGSWCNAAADRDLAAGAMLKMRQMKPFNEGSALLPLVVGSAGCWDGSENEGAEDDEHDMHQGKGDGIVDNEAFGSRRDTYDYEKITRDEDDHDANHAAAFTTATDNGDGIAPNDTRSVGASDTSSAAASDGTDGKLSFNSLTAHHNLSAVAGPGNSWDCLYPHPQTGVAFRPRADAYAADDFGRTVLVAHAQLYALASRWGADALRRLAIHKLWQTLCCFPLQSARLARDAVPLVRFVFERTEAITPGAEGEDDYGMTSGTDMGSMWKGKGQGKRDKVLMAAEHRDLLGGLVLDFCACALEEMDAGGALDTVMANAEVARGLMKRAARRFA